MLKIYYQSWASETDYKEQFLQIFGLKEFDMDLVDLVCCLLFFSNI